MYLFCYDAKVKYADLSDVGWGRLLDFNLLLGNKNCSVDYCVHNKILKI